MKVAVVVVPDSSSFSLCLGVSSSFSFGVINGLAWLPFIMARMVKVVAHTCTFVCTKCYFSTTVQQICMKFDVVLAPTSDYLCLVLWHWSSFSFV